MRKVTKYSCERGAEITLILNDHDKVIGLEAYFEEPIDIVDFRLEQAFQARLKNMMPPTPHAMPAGPKMVYQTPTKIPCPGCKGSK